MLINRFLGLMLLVVNLFFVSVLSADSLMKDSDVVLKDSGIEVTRQELYNAAKYWPKGTRAEAVESTGARFSLLNNFMQNRKIAEELKKITVESDPEFYWQREFAIRNLQNKLFMKHFKDTLKIPDMTELAKERLLVNREKFTASPEMRKASHILIKCLPGKCDRDEKRPIAEKVLKELRAGANFEEMVEKYSEDPGSKARKGALDKWMRRSEARMDGYFVEGVYSIKEVGKYSDLVETQFGFHIIRLDEISKTVHSADKVVLPKLIKALEDQYKKLSEVAFVSTLTLSDNAFIDDEAVSKILAEYKPAEKSKVKKKKGLVIKKFTRP